MKHGFTPYMTINKTRTENYGSQRDNITISNGDRFPTQYIDIKCNKCVTLHPTQKPVALIEYLVKTYTNENDIVLDFTAGSGTTGIACMETNRRCVLIEKEVKYCEITIKRLQDKEKEIAERLF